MSARRLSPRKAYADSQIEKLKSKTYSYKSAGIVVGQGHAKIHDAMDSIVLSREELAEIIRWYDRPQPIYHGKPRKNQ